MSTKDGITIEQLRDWVAEIERVDPKQRAELHQQIQAYARILAIKEPETFVCTSVRYADEVEQNESFTADQKLFANTGPALRSVRESGFQESRRKDKSFYEWCAETADAGVYVDSRGLIWGRLVKISIEWNQISDWQSIPLQDLKAAEAEMRALAFPFISGQEVR